MKKILAPIQANDGCSFYRIETPSAFIHADSFRIVPRRFLINKYISTGRLRDYLKWAERFTLFEQAKNYDAVWISRSLLSFANRMDSHIRRAIYDFDDAVWLNGEADHCFERYCREAPVVFAGNAFLAEHASRFSKRVEIVPTGVDTRRYENVNRQSGTFNIGWIGSATGFKYLQDIEEPLKVFLRDRKDARLVIVSERFPGELKSLEEFIVYIPWSREGDVAALNTFSIGIMPLRDNLWERGKCSFKMLQYMACELPVVVSPVGMNKEVLDLQKVYGEFGFAADRPSDWLEGLTAYYAASEQERRRHGESGRSAIKARYDAQTISRTIENHFTRYL